MTARAVRVYPDPILKVVAQPFDEIDDEARDLARDLVDTMRAYQGCVGLAANQIGVGARCIVVDVTGHRKARSAHGVIVLFNPVILERSGAEIGREGCLSLPDLTADVSRATHVHVSGVAVDGAPCSIHADAFEARALQHEVDHLDGVLFLDRVASLTTDVFRRRRAR